mgnify:CR=1 FL=1
MPSAIRDRDLPPHLQARYGVGRRPWGAYAIAGLLIAGFLAALALVAYNVLSPNIQPKLLAWKVMSPDHVDVTFEVRRPAEDDVYCVIRAQDESQADVGYAVVELPAGTPYEQQVYPLRTLAPAYVVDVLGCQAGGPPQRVPPPQFPPGVVPPAQPWTPAG